MSEEKNSWENVNKELAGNPRPAQPFNAFQTFKAWFENNPKEVFRLEKEVTPYSAALSLYKGFVSDSTVGNLLRVTEPVIIFVSYGDDSSRKETFKYAFKVKVILEWDSRVMEAETDD